MEIFKEKDHSGDHVTRKKCLDQNSVFEAVTGLKLNLKKVL